MQVEGSSGLLRRGWHGTTACISILWPAFPFCGLEQGWQFAFLVDSHVLPPLVWELDF